jgi:hypothetical protein
LNQTKRFEIGIPFRLSGSLVVGTVGRYNPEGFPTVLAYIAGIKVEYNDGYCEM